MIKKVAEEKDNYHSTPQNNPLNHSPNIPTPMKSLSLSSSLTHSLSIIILPWLGKKEIIKYSVEIFWFYVNIMIFASTDVRNLKSLSFFISESGFKCDFAWKFLSNWFWITHFQLDRDKSFDWFRSLRRSRLSRRRKTMVKFMCIKAKSLICRTGSGVWEWRKEKISIKSRSLLTSKCGT